MKEISIYCDGSAIGNPGPGGWGVILYKDKKVREWGGAEKHTTNNRMELTAAIEALRSEKGNERIVIKTDSEYVINGITKWVFGWRRNGWITAQKTEVLNKDLWEKLLIEVEKHEVEFIHVRGHSGNVLNDRVDQIANSYARGLEVSLFNGLETEYKKFVEEIPKTVSSSKKGKAYSYISMIKGVIKTHATWAECENRVKEIKGARYKKALSKEEEKTIIEAFKKLGVKR